MKGLAAMDEAACKANLRSRCVPQPSGWERMQMYNIPHGGQGVDAQGFTDYTAEFLLTRGEYALLPRPPERPAPRPPSRGANMSPSLIRQVRTPGLLVVRVNQRTRPVAQSPAACRCYSMHRGRGVAAMHRRVPLQVHQRAAGASARSGVGPRLRRAPDSSPQLLTTLAT